MSGEETQGMMVRMIDMFFGSMNSEEKKQFMMEKMMESMSAEDKQELMNSMMKNMMSKMSGTTKQKDIQPSEFCPCCSLCEENFKKKHNIK
jgi:hypothetical protein